MRTLYCVGLLAAVTASASAFAPAATFDCVKANSDIALMLAVTNKGPDAVRKGASLRWTYTTDGKRSGAKSGTFVTDAVFEPGAKTGIYAGSDWQTPVASCHVMLVRPTKRPGQ